MPVFKTINGNSLKQLNAISLSKEKDLQQLLEKNLLETLGLQFLATEYTTTSGGRIDTLAVDADGAPVIIEYKRNRNDNVINQALSYLKWLNTQKPGFFQKLMIDTLGQKISDEIGLDWKNPRVICIAEAFSRFDIDTIHFVSSRIELIRYRAYEDGIFTLEQISLGESVQQEELSKLPDKEPEPTNLKIQRLLEKCSSEIKAIFYDLRERVSAIDEAIIEKPTIFYVGYRVSKNFAEVHLQKNALKIFLRPIDYNDPRKIVQPISEKQTWTLNQFVYLSTQDDLEYVLGLIEQSYKDVL